MGRIVGGGEARGRVVPTAVLDARDEAATLRTAARADADALRARADEERAEAVKQGREEGRAAGAAEIAALLVGARVQAEQLREAATPAAIAIARKMAEQIVGRAVALAPEMMADIAGAALEACRPRGDWVRVRVHPDDAAAVIARKQALAARAPTAAALDVVTDEAVGRFGCVIETAVGRVDARLETQLAALERALTQDSHG
jgi:flagellar biosynthesis/type III secretory pathway protein FliH